MKLSFSSKTQIRVRYGETDQMGYCYYGNYAQYFEVGRVEALRSLGMSYRSLEQKGVMLPVSHFSINYKSPALYDDLLTVQTTINEIKGARIHFSYTIENEQNKLICIGETTLVFVDKSSMKPTSAPEFFKKLLEEHVIEQ